MAEVTRENLAIARSMLRRGIRKVKWTTQNNPKDRFGRQYTVHLGRADLHPVGQFTREFSENVPVPDQYLSIPQGSPGLVEIDFEKWYKDAAAAQDRWHERERQVRIAIHGSEGHEREPSAESLRIAGPKPMPKELVALYAAGDEWCLGLRPRTNPTEAVRVLFDKYADASQRQRFLLGQTPTTASRTNAKLGLPRELAALVKKDRAAAPAPRTPAPAPPVVPPAETDDDAPINPEG